MKTTKEKKSEEKVYDLTFGVKRSVRYHHSRARYYSSVHRTAMFCSLFMTMAAGTLVFYEMPILAGAFGVIVALLAAYDASIDSANGCARHMMLAYRFQELERRWLSANDISDKAYKNAYKERLEIEQDEPPPYRLLDAMCHFELKKSTGEIDRIPKIPWYRRLFAHFKAQTEYAQRLDEKD